MNVPAGVHAPRHRHVVLMSLGHDDGLMATSFIGAWHASGHEQRPFSSSAGNVTCGEGCVMNEDTSVGWLMRSDLKASFPSACVNWQQRDSPYHVWRESAFARGSRSMTRQPPGLLVMLSRMPSQAHAASSGKATSPTRKPEEAANSRRLLHLNKRLLPRWTW
jgi:hypothetical protein